MLKNDDKLFVELRQIMTGYKRAIWDAAEIVSKLSAMGHTLEEIRQRAQIDEDITSLSRWRSVYNYYCKQLDACDTVRDALPVQTLYDVKNLVQDSGWTADQIVKFVDDNRGLSRREVLSNLKMLLGLDGGLDDDWASIKLPRPVYDMFDEASQRLDVAAEMSGVPIVSGPVFTIEFMSKLISETPTSELADLVAREMGEVKDA